MNFNIKKPCALCPFRTDCQKGWLRREKASAITHSITTLQQSFPCHETTGAKGPKPKKGESHCAGALILLEKIGRPNHMMRIAERLSMYDRFSIKMDAPVFDSIEDLINHHSKD